MSWAKVRTLFLRELRDQVRDRRTLFMIFVLPVLLYPMLGISLSKYAEVFQEQARTVVLVGAEHLDRPATDADPAPANAEDPAPPLLAPDGATFNPALFDVAQDAARLQVVRVPAGSEWSDAGSRRVLLRQGKADAVVEIPTDLMERLRDLGRSAIPIYYNSADEKSQVTFLRVDRVLERWRDWIVEQRREQEGKPEGYTDPVRAEAMDIATSAETGGSVWARVFPFLLVMMALTGAFYPAVDLCAGEKERGTMETLLISPATRGEIVAGKFLTVLVVSMGTALLNLASMALTGLQLTRGLRGVADPAERAVTATAALAPPSLASLLWMVVLLVPLAAFFSALCLALAVMARSMKEGQYYMTPLYLVAIPLIFLTIAPGITLTPFTSLIPITGLGLLLKTLMLGDYANARSFALPVLVPLGLYAWLALRWAVEQFRSESVLFRESERFDLRGWVRHLIRDRQPLPTPGQAVLCFALMLAAAWYLTLGLGPGLGSLLAMQLGAILAPPLVLAWALTTRPVRTLRLAAAPPRYHALAAGLALSLHPLVAELRRLVDLWFPATDAVRELQQQLGAMLPDLGTALFLLAVVPAFCEEVAFRGFILSGLEQGNGRRTAIVQSALLFGVMHVLLSLMQQLFNATLLGLVLGLLAVRSGSLLPGILFHVLNNALGVITGTVISSPGLQPLARTLYRDPSEALYQGHWVAIGAVVSAVLLAVLVRSGGSGEPRDEPLTPE